MQQSNFKVYGYRWVMLLVFMAAVAVNQLLWITFAPITGDAASYYGVDELSIGLLSLVFLIVYIFVSIPASWVIDTFGIRAGIGIGVLLTGAFGFTRGIFASSYSLVLLSQVGIAVGQPFILNAVTTVAARWFPIQERATAAGLGSLAIYLGILVGLGVTPYLAVQSGITGMLVVYGIISVGAALLFLILSRERPPTPPCPPDQEQRSLVLEGLKQTLRSRNFVFLMLIFFVGLGAFNAVTTWIEEILAPRGFSSTQAGDAGGVMIVGGIVGALVIPALSDRYRKRTPFLVLALTGAAIGLVGITFSDSYLILLISAFVFGFFLLSAGPVGFQYGAEVAYPAPEGTSNGLLLLMGQVSGIVFIFGMDGLKSTQTGSMTFPLVGLIVLFVAGLILCTRLGDSKGLAVQSATSS